MTVHAPHPSLERTFRLGVEMSHLHARVHTRISPAGTDELHGHLGNLRKGMLDRVLDGSAMRLNLPALESIAVIFDAYCNPHLLTHQTISTTRPQIANLSGQRRGVNTTVKLSNSARSELSVISARQPPGGGDST